MSESFPSPVLVVSAHAADFVWRSAGYIARSTASGAQVNVVCLSFGERGESQGAWGRPDMTLEKVKAIRCSEAERAGAILGAEMEFFDQGDYPLPDNDVILNLLVEKLRSVQPALILTHSQIDPYNYDHPRAADLTMRARMVAQAIGHPSTQPPLGAPPVFRFEPHQPEMCDFRPDVLVDITSVMERKEAAMAAMGSQDHMPEYYRDLAKRRGVQAVRNGGPKSIKFAEAYQRVFPQVSEVLW